MQTQDIGAEIARSPKLLPPCREQSGWALRGQGYQGTAVYRCKSTSINDSKRLQAGSAAIARVPKPLSRLCGQSGCYPVDMTRWYSPRNSLSKERLIILQLWPVHYERPPRIPEDKNFPASTMWVWRKGWRRNREGRSIKKVVIVETYSQTKKLDGIYPHWRPWSILSSKK